MRLRYLGEGYDESCEGEYGHCDDHCRSCVLYACVLHLSAHEVTQEYRSDGAAYGVAGTAELNESVALVSAAAQGVEHRVDDDVEHTHREAGDEGADHIYEEALRRTGNPLDGHTDETDDDGGEGGELISLPLEYDAGRNAHAGIGNEVGEGAEL